MWPQRFFKVINIRRGVSMGRRGEERNSVKFNAWPPTPTFHQSLFLKGQQCTLRTNKVIFFRNRFDDACVKVSGCFLLWWSSNPILLYIRQKLLMSSFLTPLQPFSQRFFLCPKGSIFCKRAWSLTEGVGWYVVWLFVFAHLEMGRQKKSFLSKNVANFKFNFGSVKIYNSIVEKK